MSGLASLVSLAMSRSLKEINHRQFSTLAMSEVEKHLEEFVQLEDRKQWDWKDQEEIIKLQNNIISLMTRAQDNYAFLLAVLTLDIIYSQLICEKCHEFVRDLMEREFLYELLDGWTRKKSKIESLCSREIMFLSFLLKFNIIQVPRLQPMFEKIARSLLSFVEKAGPAVSDQRSGAIKRLFMAYNEDVRDLYLKNMDHQDLSDLHKYFEAQVDYCGNFSYKKRWISETKGISKLMRRIGAKKRPTDE